jgi:hypothetical protein
MSLQQLYKYVSGHAPLPFQAVILDNIYDAMQRKRKIVIALPPQHGLTSCAVTAAIAKADDTLLTGSEIDIKLLSKFFSKHAPNHRFDWRTKSLYEYGEKIFQTYPMGASLIGRRTNFLVHLQEDEHGYSATEHRMMLDWFMMSALPRLGPEGSAIVFCYRYRNDLASSLIEMGWDYLPLRAVCMNSDSDPMRRNPGEYLQPQKAQELEKTRKRIGQYAWNSMYQQDPSLELVQ